MSTKIQPHIISYHIILYFHNLKTQYNEKITKYKDTTYGGVIKRPMRPVSDYPFDKKIYEYILQRKHVDIIITQELHKLHKLIANKMHLNKLKGYYICSKT